MADSLVRVSSVPCRNSTEAVLIGLPAGSVIVPVSTVGRSISATEEATLAATVPAEERNSPSNALGVASLTSFPSKFHRPASPFSPPVKRRNMFSRICSGVRSTTQTRTSSIWPWKYSGVPQFEQPIEIELHALRARDRRQVHPMIGHQQGRHHHPFRFELRLVNGESQLAVALDPDGHPVIGIAEVDELSSLAQRFAPHPGFDRGFVQVPKDVGRQIDMLTIAAQSQDTVCSPLGSAQRPACRDLQIHACERRPP